ncbi:MAG: hypothetical protein MUF10_02890 [Thermoanaerobaculaceae bacterium]|nr:hypothetical protein [Thermoanaerobaculaceae bacterium]
MPKPAVVRSVMLVVVLVALAGTVPVPATACTTAVISGAATADGRPLLWKNRDADDLHNQVVYREDGRYAYVGVVNQGDTAGLQIWAGVNSAGFAIMNSASYNLDDAETTAEGMLMKLALQSCATLADFERLLGETNLKGARDTTANFGVIDAQGGAAYFETGLTTFKRFDATDPAAAPRGYLIRTNYSDTGTTDTGSGLLRRQRATALVDELVAAGALNASTLLGRVSRDVANPNTGAFPLQSPAAARFAWVGDSINRDITASVTLISGVKAGGDPAFSTAWFILGQPVTGVASPVWVKAASVPRELAAGAEPAPLNAACDRVRARLYPTWRGDQKRYLEVSALAAKDTGVLAPLLAQEGRVLAAVRAAEQGWGAQPPSAETLRQLQARLATETLAAIDAIAPPRRTP